MGSPSRAAADRATARCLRRSISTASACAPRSAAARAKAMSVVAFTRTRSRSTSAERSTVVAMEEGRRTTVSSPATFLARPVAVSR
jgi:hypothetical protein